MHIIAIFVIIVAINISKYVTHSIIVTLYHFMSCLQDGAVYVSHIGSFNRSDYNYGNHDLVNLIFSESQKLEQDLKYIVYKWCSAVPSFIPLGLMERLKWVMQEVQFLISTPEMEDQWLIPLLDLLPSFFIPGQLIVT